jgi:hypothetical protein
MQILERLKVQAAAATQPVAMPAHLSWYDPGPAIRHRATLEQISDAQQKLGFSLPPLLRSIYLEIGNGGYGVGPGIYGIGSFSDSTDCQDAVAMTRDMANEFCWWKEYLVIADQGCSMYSCIDCGDSSYPVYRLDGNGYPETPMDYPTTDYWYLEAVTLEDWFSDYLDRQDQKLLLGTPVSKPKMDRDRPWWRFW